MHFLFELILQPMLELAAHVVGYATAYVIVPIFTLGQVVVEPRRGRFQMGRVLAMWIGLLFWAIVAVVVYWVRSGNAGS